MPRLPPKLLHHAQQIDPHLARLLPACRDLTTARLELKWLKEHSFQIASKRSQPGSHRTAIRQRQLLEKLVCARATGKPLQYVIGTEFFGDLEIRCRKNVLIPRQETADWIEHLVQRIVKSGAEIKHFPSKLKVLDLCTGTGCISLLFQHILSRQIDTQALILSEIHTLGVDVSPTAIQLARHNHKLYTKSFSSETTTSNSGSPWYIQSPSSSPPSSRISFLQHDIFSSSLTTRTTRMGMFPIDILLSNPPYISPTSYDHQTARSVRKFEPKLALVPPSSRSSPTSGSRSDSLEPDSLGDTFYPRLLELANETCAKIAAFEVSDEHQALRVTELAKEQRLWDGIEVWRDVLGMGVEGGGLVEYRGEIPVRGSGHGRVVVCWRGDGGRWLGCLSV